MTTNGSAVRGDSPLPELVIGHPRSVSLDVHRHVRRLIIDNVLPAGSVLKQAQLAREFGVSRTPMREAFRMLQEEGLIEAETNQRARVRDLDLEELDQLYGARIALESLGARITAGRLTEPEVAHARALLDLMLSRPVDVDPEGWMLAHREFHGLCVARAGEPLQRVIVSYAERSERFLRAHQRAHPRAFLAADRQHREILDALVDGAAERVGSLMGAHLSHTSLAVLNEAGPGHPALATRAALAMAGAPADLPE